MNEKMEQVLAHDRVYRKIIEILKGFRFDSSTGRFSMAEVGVNVPVYILVGKKYIYIYIYIYISRRYY